MIGDIRFAIRSLGRSRIFTLSAVLTLSLGIGVNTAIFSLANTVLFRSRAGVADPARIVWLATVSRDTGRRSGMSYPDYLDYRSGTTGAFTDVGAFSNVPVSLGGGGTPERIRGQMITGSLWSTLGAPISNGRAIVAADDVRGGPAIAIISDRLWKRRFSGSADVFGTPLILNGREFAVVGIAGPEFRGPATGDEADVWLPMSMWPDVRASDRDLLDSRGSSWLTVLARLRPGESVGQAQSAVSTVAAELAARYPDADRNRSAIATGAGSPVSPQGRTALLPIAALLLGVTALVLLIACANLANLLLARGAGRTAELAIRSSLGASRARLVRQLLTESLVLACAGAAGGLSLASWGAGLVIRLAGSEFEDLHATADSRVLLFTAALGLITVCLSALVPALTTTRADVMNRLRTAGGGTGRSRLQGLFVVAQLALSLVLLLAAGLSLSALKQSTSIDFGFTADHLATASYDLVLQNYPEPRRDTFRAALLSRILALGDVEAATITNVAPFDSTSIGARATAGRDRAAMTSFTAVGPAYFSTLEIPVLRGRGITDHDVTGAPRAAVMNQTLARMLFGQADPIGQSIQLHARRVETLQIVGVARDAKYDDPAEDQQPFLYLALAQEAALDSETLVVRTRAGASNTGPTLERIIHGLDAALPVYDVRPFSQILWQRTENQRMLSLLFSAFGALALALAALGLYGVMTYATTRRSREFGLRLALGASPARLAAMVARDGIGLGLLGTAIGSALGLPLARAAGALLFGVHIGDVAVFVSACAALNVIVLAAALIPARRAALADPMTTLRME